MTGSDLMEALAEVPGVLAVDDGSVVRVAISAIELEVGLAADSVVAMRLIEAPNGTPALMMLLDIQDEPVQVIISDTDLAYPPDASDHGLEYGIAITVEDMPPLVGYTEMMRDLETAASRLAGQSNLDNVMGTVVMLRYFINGAMRLGIDCSRPLELWRPLKDMVSD